jgi:hypothetical protein
MGLRGQETASRTCVSNLIHWLGQGSGLISGGHFLRRPYNLVVVLALLIVTVVFTASAVDKFDVRASRQVRTEIRSNYLATKFRYVGFCSRENISVISPSPNEKLAVKGGLSSHLRRNGFTQIDSEKKRLWDVLWNDGDIFTGFRGNSYCRQLRIVSFELIFRWLRKEISQECHTTYVNSASSPGVLKHGIFGPVVSVGMSRILDSEIVKILEGKESSLHRSQRIASDFSDSAGFDSLLLSRLGKVVGFIQCLLHFHESSVGSSSRVVIGRRLVDILSIEFIPLEPSKYGVNNDHADPSNLKKILPPFAAYLMCCAGLYSIYRGIRNIKLVGDWRGQFFFYLGVGLFAYGAFILVSLAREVPYNFLDRSNKNGTIVFHI